MFNKGTLWTESWCSVYRLCQVETHAYVFCDIDRFHELKQHMELRRLGRLRTPHRPQAQFRPCPSPQHGPRRQV